jgi:hypothetical protein
VGPEGLGNQWDVDLAVPHGAGAWQGLRGGGSGRAGIQWSYMVLGSGGAQGVGILLGLFQWSHVELDPGGAEKRGVPRCREPGRAEHQNCGPMGWGLGGPAVLLVDHGVEKTSTI